MLIKFSYENPILLYVYVFHYDRARTITFEILNLDLKFLLSADEGSVKILNEHVHKQRRSTQNYI